MPVFHVCTFNSTFVSCDDGADYARPEDALLKGLYSASRIACDEIDEGKTHVAIEVRVKEITGKIMLRSILNMSVSPLFIPSASPDENHRPTSGPGA